VSSDSEFAFELRVCQWAEREWTPARAGLPEAIQLPMIVTLPLAAIAAGFVALAIGPVIFRLSGHYFAIGTLALATIIQLLLLDQRGISGGSTGYYVQGGLEANYVYLIGLAATVGMVVVTSYVINSRIGLGMRAVHGDEDAASTLGVHPLRYKLWAFSISSAMAGLAGALWAQYTLYVNPESTLGVVWMIDTLVVVILGGMGTMLGPLLGAALFLTLDTGLRAVAGEFATTVEGALIILFILFAPAGLYGLIKSRLDADDTSTPVDDAADPASGPD